MATDLTPEEREKLKDDLGNMLDIMWKQASGRADTMVREYAASLSRKKQAEFEGEPRSVFRADVFKRLREDFFDRAVRIQDLVFRLLGEDPPCTPPTNQPATDGPPDSA